MKNNLLMVFAKNPELGKAKTRLAATVGDTAALRVYKELLDHTRKVTTHFDGIKQVHYAQFIAKDDEWQQESFLPILQIEGDLGEKMQAAFEQGFSLGNEKVIIIGSDCYELRTEDLTNAISALDEADVVIGPAEDGGYYLLGMKNTHQFLFENKSWSTDRLLTETVDSLSNKGKSYELLRQLSDIDREEDLINHPKLIELLKK